jgi:hypothetical protein
VKSQFRQSRGNVIDGGRTNMGSKYEPSIGEGIGALCSREGGKREREGEGKHRQ